MPSYPSNKCPEEDKEQEIKLLLGNIPTFLSYLINFYFNARSAQRTNRGGFLSPLPKSTDWILSVVNRCGMACLVAVNRPKKLLQLQRCELANEFVHRPSLPFSDGLILAPSNGRA